MSYGMDQYTREIALAKLAGMGNGTPEELKEFFEYMEGVFHLAEFEVKKVLQEIDPKVFGIIFKFFPRIQADHFIKDFSTNVRNELVNSALQKVNLSEAYQKLIFIETKLKVMEGKGLINMRIIPGGDQFV